MSSGSSILRIGELVDLEIETLAFGGQGLAHHHNLVVFVNGVLPGDRVQARIYKLKSNFAEADPVKFLRHSPFRVTPRCSHFGICGGCKWQNLEYSKQTEYKTQQVREALQHIGGITDPPVGDALPADEIYFYRHKMEFSFSVDPEGKPILGLHLAGKFDRVFDLRACYLQSEISNRIVQKIKTFCREKNLTIYDLKQFTGFLRFLVIKEAKSTGEMMVNFVTQKGSASELKILALELIGEFPAIKSVVRNINTQRAQIAVGEKEELLAGRSFILEKLGPFSFQISANSFFQSNPQQAEKLYQLADEWADLRPEDVVLDLYSGTGTISFFLAQKAKEVVGIEFKPETIADAQNNARLNQIANCRFICSEAKDYLALARVRGEKYAVVMVDPPRSGLHSLVVENLLKIAPAKIIYVSCNPATLARDLKLFCQGDYLLEKAQPVDMFPHTYHIETICKLVRK